MIFAVQIFQWIFLFPKKSLFSWSVFFFFVSSLCKVLFFTISLDIEGKPTKPSARRRKKDQEKLNQERRKKKQKDTIKCTLLFSLGSLVFVLIPIWTEEDRFIYPSPSRPEPNHLPFFPHMAQSPVVQPRNLGFLIRKFEVSNSEKLLP